MIEKVKMFFQNLVSKLKSMLFMEIPNDFDIPHYDDHQETEPVVEVSADDLSNMTKKEIDYYAESKGIKLDRRQTKQKMIDQLLNYK